MKYSVGLPADVRELCIAHVRGYDRRRRSMRRQNAGVEAHLSEQDKRSVQAVETALLLACAGIKSRQVCEKLRQGLLLNLCDRKAHPYDRLYLPGISKKDFYRRKQDLLVALAEELGYIRP